MPNRKDWPFHPAHESKDSGWATSFCCPPFPDIAALSRSQRGGLFNPPRTFERWHNVQYAAVLANIATGYIPRRASVNVGRKKTRLTYKAKAWVASGILNGARCAPYMASRPLQNRHRRNGCVDDGGGRCAFSLVADYHRVGRRPFGNAQDRLFACPPISAKFRVGKR